MAFIVKKLDEQLKCLICHSRFREAKQLQCGHTFCKECISHPIVYFQRKGVIRSSGIECPSCRCGTDSGDTGLSSRNWLMDNTLGDIDFLESDIDLLETNGAAVQICDHHGTSEMSYYCEQCEALACSDCVIDDHYDHRERPKSLDEMTEIISKEMEALMERCREREAVHDDLQRSLGDIWSEGSQVLETLVTDVTEEYEAKRKLLDEEKNRLLDDIASKKSHLRNSLDRAVSADKMVTSRVTQARIAAMIRLRRGSKAEVVTSFKKWAKELRKDLDVEIQGTSDKYRELADLLTLYLETSEYSPSIGEIQRLESNSDDSIPVSTDDNSVSSDDDSVISRDDDIDC
ncbi:tripartite motif-containing protein 73-like [Diadema antillarum]|uniref:tripartite motif-containing protein 73-like n=1 Tax=Diadema antillarum TaxID=105358 RepID=UPI003A83765A